MGTTESDHSPMTEEPTPTRQRDLALQAGRVAYRAEHGRWPSRSWKLPAPVADTPYYSVTFTKVAPPAAPPVPFKSLEREAWDRAYGDRPITPEAAVWDDRGYCRWLPETNKMGSRLAHSRNFPTNN
jgi:hypothetical protein